MKPLSFHVSKPQQETVKVEMDLLPHFYDSLHFHNDNQITLIKKSFGTLYIADKIIPFAEGDVFFIGENLAHVFRNDPSFYFPKHSRSRAESISIYFENDFLGDTFYYKPEFFQIRDFIATAKNGFKIKNELKSYIQRKMQLIPGMSGIERVIQLLDILDKMARSKDLEMLSNIGFTKKKASDNARIGAVLDHLINNFHTSISLKEVAAIANLSETSFCRYFKLHTRKTFSTYLSEVRIGHACKLLVEMNYSINQICFKCGFNNISNFNRQFKSIVKYTPKEYMIRQRLASN